MVQQRTCTTREYAAGVLDVCSFTDRTTAAAAAAAAAAAEAVGSAQSPVMQSIRLLRHSLNTAAKPATQVRPCLLLLLLLT
jgi:hypothetical protein